MKLSIVFFFRALLFFALATSLAAEYLVPGTELQSIANVKEYLSKSRWIREAVRGEVGRFFINFLIDTHVDPQAVSRFLSFLQLCSCGFDKLDRTMCLVWVFLLLIGIHIHFTYFAAWVWLVAPRVRGL